jgi:cytochrome d ubiquinol oxidase subunit II
LEFRNHARHQVFWEWAFGFGSLTASLAQGFILGGLLSGLQVEGDSFAGGVWDWLNPYAALVAVGLTLGYLLLGAAYLILKTDGEMRFWGCRQAGRAAWAALIAALAATLTGISRHPFLWSRWFSWPGVILTLPPLLFGLMAFVLLMRSLSPDRRETAPFLFSLLFFGFFFLCLAGSLYPYLIPPLVTAGQAAAQPLILKVMLAVMVVLLPVMFLYNAYQYWVFRGKTGGYGA